MNGKRSLRERASQPQEITVRRAPDYSNGRGFDPLSPHLDGLARVLITCAPAIDAETGEISTQIHVDYFNCASLDEMRWLYFAAHATVVQIAKAAGE